MNSFAELAFPVRQRSRLRIGARWVRRDHSPLITLSLGVMSQLTNLDVSSVASPFDHILTGTMTGSVAVDLRESAPQVLSLSSQRRLGTARVAGVVFMDSNGDGTRGANEPGVPAVSVLIGERTVDTNDDGFYCVSDLDPFVPLAIAVDSSTLPAMSKAVPAIRITPPADGTSRVDIPISAAPSPGSPAHFLRDGTRARRITQNAQGSDSATVHGNYLELGAVYSHPVSNPRQSAKSREDVAAERRPVTLRNVEVVVIPCVDEGKRTGELEHTIQFQRGTSGHVILVRDVAQ
jgi:hypothetical protein